MLCRPHSLHTCRRQQRWSQCTKCSAVLRPTIFCFVLQVLVVKVPPDARLHPFAGELSIEPCGTAAATCLATSAIVMQHSVLLVALEQSSGLLLAKLDVQDLSNISAVQVL